MLPLYRPGTKPPNTTVAQTNITNLQRRVVHHISQPLIESPREEPLLSTTHNNGGGGGGKRQLGLWIASSVMVFWIVLVTLFFISHVATSSRSQKISFSMLPEQLSFNVSLERFPWVTSISWHRTCCWNKENHYCDGSGFFSVHIEKKSLIVHVLQPDVVAGAFCTFHGGS